MVSYSRTVMHPADRRFFEIPHDRKLDKEQTSYDNVLDAFRLALKVIRLVKKRIDTI